MADLDRVNRVLFSCFGFFALNAQSCNDRKLDRLRTGSLAETLGEDVFLAVSGGTAEYARTNGVSFHFMTPRLYGQMPCPSKPAQIPPSRLMAAPISETTGCAACKV